MSQIRRATDADAAAVAEVYLASFRAALPTVRHGHDDDEIRSYIAGFIGQGGECWVAVEDGDVLAMMFLTPGWIDQLYVAPDRIGQGIGRQLLDLAKDRGENKLQLWTFQVNERARRFYERNGFEAAELTDGSGNEEREPDVRYVWSSSSTPRG